MIFFLIAFIGMCILRLIGWSLSKKILYWCPTTLAICICFIWGGSVAFAVHILIREFTPHIILKIIMGYGAGAYASIPNFGLLDRATIPDVGGIYGISRHDLISNFSLLIYIIASIIFAFFF